MQVLYPRCAGLDVHKDSVVARIRCVSAPLHDEVRSFATTTSALMELSDWLSEHGVTHVAMEATGLVAAAISHSEFLRHEARPSGNGRARDRIRKVIR
jgi:transposase